MSPKTRELVNRFQSSGLTQQAFCRKHSIPITTLQYHLARHKKEKALTPVVAHTWDRHGFWLLYMRLEAGCLQIPPNEPHEIPCGLPVSYPLAIGRKNYLFCGLHDATRRAGIIYSLVSMAKLHGIDPFVYIKDLLTRLPACTSKQIDQFLLPQ